MSSGACFHSSTNSQKDIELNLLVAVLFRDIRRLVCTYEKGFIFAESHYKFLFLRLNIFLYF